MCKLAMELGEEGQYPSCQNDMPGPYKLPVSSPNWEILQICETSLGVEIAISQCIRHNNSHLLNAAVQKAQSLNINRNQNSEKACDVNKNFFSNQTSALNDVRIKASSWRLVRSPA